MVPLTIADIFFSDWIFAGGIEVEMVYSEASAGAIYDEFPCVALRDDSYA